MKKTTLKIVDSAIMNCFERFWFLFIANIPDVSPWVIVIRMYKTTSTVRHFIFNWQNVLNSLETQLTSSSIETIIIYMYTAQPGHNENFFSSYRKKKNKSHFALFQIFSFMFFFIALLPLLLFSLLCLHSLFLHTYTLTIQINGLWTKWRKISSIEILLPVQSFFFIQ